MSNTHTLKIILVLCSYFFIINITAQERPLENSQNQAVESQDSILVGTTFKVSDVKVTTYDIPETTYKRAIEKKINRKIQGFPIECKDKKLVPTDLNPFVAAVHFAYAEHRPLIISPDMVWLLICQGFAIHVSQNQEKLRDKLVTHNGTKDILVIRHDFRLDSINPWPEVFAALIDSMKPNIKDSLYDLVVADFSTTGAKEKAAFEVTLLESLQKYFAATLWTACGIPEITLEGTVEDWQWIRNHVGQFAHYGLEDWVSNLEPILDQFVDAAQGQVDSIFWQSIYKRSTGYNAIYLSGWIIKFFPYYLAENHSKNGAYMSYKLNPYIDGEDYYLSTFRVEDFPSGLSKYEFKWLYIVDLFDMEAYGGFVGFAQNKTTKALRPEISWAIRDKKTPWLGDKKFPYATLNTENIEYWHPRIAQKPTIYPIFNPEVNKTYRESELSLKAYLKEGIKQLKKVEILKGKVQLKFIITWAGTITNVKIIQSAGDKEDKLAIELIKAMPKWSPAREAHPAESHRGGSWVNYAKIVVLDFNDK